MKKIFALTAASMILAATSTFAACPINMTHNSACKIGTPTGYAAPVSYVVAPVQQRTYLPPCNNCNNQVAKKGFFSRMFTPVQNVYGATLGPIFTGLYD